MKSSSVLFGLALVFSTAAWAADAPHSGAMALKPLPKHPFAVVKPKVVAKAQAVPKSKAAESKTNAWTTNACADTVMLHGKNGRVYFYARHGEAKTSQDDLLFCFNGVNACINNRQWQRGLRNTSENGALTSALPFDLNDGNYTMVTVTRKMPNGQFCFNTMSITRHGENYVMATVTNPNAAFPVQYVSNNNFNRGTGGYGYGDQWGMIGQLNAIRAQNGLPALAYDPSMDGAAYANNVYQRSYCPNGACHLLTREGYSGVGYPNIAEWGSNNAADAAAGYASSPAHLGYILGPYRYAGVNYDGLHWTVTFR